MPVEHVTFPYRDGCISRLKQTKFLYYIKLWDRIAMKKFLGPKITVYSYKHTFSLSYRFTSSHSGSESQLPFQMFLIVYSRKKAHKIEHILIFTAATLNETAAAASSRNARPIFLRKGVYSCYSKTMEISVCFRLASLISLEHTSFVRHSPQSSRNLCCKTGSGSEFAVAHIQCGEKLIRTFLLGLNIHTHIPHQIWAIPFIWPIPIVL